MAYGVLLTALLYELLDRLLRLKANSKKLTTIVCSVSSASNELYLAHIPFVYFIFMIEMKLQLPYFLKFVFIVSSAIIGLAFFRYITGKVKERIVAK